MVPNMDDDNHKSDRWLLIEARLGEPLREFVARQRGDEYNASWRRISLRIRDKTGIDVTAEALRSWLK